MNVPENKTRLISWPVSGPKVSCQEIFFERLSKNNYWVKLTNYVILIKVRNKQKTVTVHLFKGKTK